MFFQHAIEAYDPVAEVWRKVEGGWEIYAGIPVCGGYPHLFLCQRVLGKRRLGDVFCAVTGGLPEAMRPEVLYVIDVEAGSGVRGGEGAVLEAVIV